MGTVTSKPKDDNPVAVATSGKNKRPILIKKRVLIGDVINMKYVLGNKTSEFSGEVTYQQIYLACAKLSTFAYWKNNEVERKLSLQALADEFNDKLKLTDNCLRSKCSKSHSLAQGGTGECEHSKDVSSGINHNLESTRLSHFHRENKYCHCFFTDEVDGKKGDEQNPAVDVEIEKLNIKFSITASCAGYMIITFRGTTNKENWLKNIETNLIEINKARKEKIDAAVEATAEETEKAVDLDQPQEDSYEVHLGFWRIFDRIRQKLQDRIEKHAEKCISSNKKETTALKTVIFTGHSLGGALATISYSQFMSKWMKDQVHENIKNVKYECVTFGAPRVGNLAFARDFRKQCQYFTENGPTEFGRFVHKNDIVPRLPADFAKLVKAAIDVAGNMFAGPTDVQDKKTSTAEDMEKLLIEHEDKIKARGEQSETEDYNDTYPLPHDSIIISIMKSSGYAMSDLILPASLLNRLHAIDDMDEYAHPVHKQVIDYVSDKKVDVEDLFILQKSESEKLRASKGLKDVAETVEISTGNRQGRSSKQSIKNTTDSVKHHSMINYLASMLLVELSGDVDDTVKNKKNSYLINVNKAMSLENANEIYTVQKQLKKTNDLLLLGSADKIKEILEKNQVPNMDGILKEYGVWLKTKQIKLPKYLEE